MIQELLDVVDSKDNVLKQVGRKDWYSHSACAGEFIRYVNAFIFDPEGYLLLPIRSDSAYLFPGAFDFSCAEHMRSGESYNIAMMCGLEEENGLVGLTPGMIGVVNPSLGVSGFIGLYELVVSDRSDVVLDADEFKECEWKTIEEVQSMLKDGSSRFKSDFPKVLEFYLSKK